MAKLSPEARALRLLAQREHSRAELAQKLAQRLPEADQPEIPVLLDRLAARGWMSDERTAEAVVRSLSSRAGIRKIEQALHAKGIGAELAQASLAFARQTELERARSLWQRRFGIAPIDAASRARQQRFLAGRGFEAETIVRLMREVASAAAEEPLAG